MRSYIDILNALFQAHRERDLITEKILSDMLDEMEIDFADTLDLMKV